MGVHACDLQFSTPFEMLQQEVPTVDAFSEASFRILRSEFWCIYKTVSFSLSHLAGIFTL